VPSSTGTAWTCVVFSGPLIEASSNDPDIKLELGGRDMPKFHPILTTDYFEYGTTTNRLDRECAAVEMGDAALGLACTELTDPPHWAVIRNMSDPVINGDLPAKQFHLNEQPPGRWATTPPTDAGPAPSERSQPGQSSPDCKNRSTEFSTGKQRSISKHRPQRVGAACLGAGSFREVIVGCQLTGGCECYCAKQRPARPR
jgi:hypothetical protein